MELRRIAVCADCSLTLRGLRSNNSANRATYLWSRRTFAIQTSPHTRARFERSRTRYIDLRKPRNLTTTTNEQPPPPSAHQAPDLQKIHSRMHELSMSVLKPTAGTIPAEERVLYVLEQMEFLTRMILDERGTEGSPQGTAKEQRETAASALLGSVKARSKAASFSKEGTLKSISERAEEIMRHPDVFITPGILKAYVQLQALLHQPSSLPDILNLYAKKAIPMTKDGQVIYSPASPNQIKSAVPSDVANAALTSAIEAHDLPLAIDIISTSFCTPAFKKSKTFTQAAFPIVGLGVAPLAAYSLSTYFSKLQQTMDPGTASGIAFAGIMTYVGAVSMVGYVAVTTANDQMDRVTWAAGVPLWERWVREEERAAIDRLAGAWGFKEQDKRGEEEGEEWEVLREWTGSRGMVLDRVSLMEGME